MLSIPADRTYLTRVTVVSMEGEVVTIRRRIFISPPSVCTVHFINGGMKVLGGGSVKVEFATRGPADSFFCKMGRGDLVPCSNGEVFSGLSHGSHLVKVVPDPDQCGTPRHSARLRFTLLE